jgi:hypothetical protein
MCTIGIAKAAVLPVPVCAWPASSPVQDGRNGFELDIGPGAWGHGRQIAADFRLNAIIVEFHNLYRPHQVLYFNLYFHLDFNEDLKGHGRNL